MAMLEVKDLQVSYGMIQAIKGISFEVNQGEVIALIGANGIGKTTLLKIMTGEIELHQPDNTSPVFVKIGSPTIGTLKQMTFDNENLTLFEELLKCYQNVIDIENRLNELQKELETNYSNKLV